MFTRIQYSDRTKEDLWRVAFTPRRDKVPVTSPAAQLSVEFE